ncbi:MAG: hypothetical protein EP329_04220 [Deltaproteobacteria bacterium]|nr:MAG: hypothetical protein EP329_04220 [Deltaproteobacteria bacterium]
MYKEVMQHNTVVDLPIFALMLFIAIFVVVSITVWRRGAANADHAHLASLPLEDDDALSIPQNDPIGGDHGRR